MLSKNVFPYNFSNGFSNCDVDIIDNNTDKKETSMAIQTITLKHNIHWNYVEQNVRKGQISK